VHPNTKHAVFLDRDGTLIEEKEYLSRPEGVVIIPGTGPALRRLMDAGYLLIVVTNQSGIGRGIYTLEDMERVNARVAEELARDGVRFEAVYFSPEAPDQAGRGRKPSPQFLHDAREAFGLALGGSYMVGDKLSDLQCGWNAGVRASVLVRTGYGRALERQDPAGVRDAWVADDVAGAVALILGDSGGRREP
jgi:D-glycero-D-manno-heptose 1,7-bisphosphate phosphatase